MALCLLGLTLIANIQQHQYVTEVGTTAGLILLVQPQKLMPFPEDRGKLVSPGYQTEIALTQVLFCSEKIRDELELSCLLYLYVFSLYISFSLTIRNSTVMVV